MFRATTIATYGVSRVFTRSYAKGGPLKFMKKLLQPEKNEIKRKFMALPEEERQLVLQKLREDVQKIQADAARDNPTPGAGVAPVKYWLAFIGALGITFAGLSYGLGIQRQNWPVLPGTIVRKDSSSVVYEYLLWGQKIRRKQDLDSSILDMLQVGSDVNVHFNPTSPKQSLIFPPTFYIPSSTVGKEVIQITAAKK